MTKIYDIIWLKGSDHMSNIVKYDNDFNLTQHFNRLNQTEQDIFFAITSEFTKRNENSIEIKINELRKKNWYAKKITNRMKWLCLLIIFPKN